MYIAEVSEVESRTKETPQQSTRSAKYAAKNVVVKHFSVRTPPLLFLLLPNVPFIF